MSDVQALKRKRSRSGSGNNADDVPPSSRRRSRSPRTQPGHDTPTRHRPASAEPSAETANVESQKDIEKRKQLDAKSEFDKLFNTRSGGVYMPPARLRALQQAASADKSSPEYQRLSWDALRKSITGIVNRVNITNIKQVVPELFEENLIRGRGLFSRSIMKAQAASLPFTPVFSALVAIINTKLPQVGELLLTRLISQFRRAYKRNDKIVCHSSTTFLGHLVNQAVAHEIIALQILVLLLERPTDDSIEIAVGFMREVGAFLAENSPKASATVFERFRAVLNEGNISQRVQYMVEVLMQVRKDKFKDNPVIPEGLDLVEEEEQITHQLQLEEELQVQEGLNVFKLDPDYLDNEEKYKAIKAEILGEESGEESGSEEEENSEEDEVVETKEGIEDRTETNLVNLRRIIYLTIMNALNYEEAVHKLLKVQLQEGQEIELVNMIIECCSQERSYSNFYGLVGERFCKLNRTWLDCFEHAFTNYYTTIHRYETNRLRNIARFFGHLLASDSVSWAVLECVKINEEDTTSSSRIFVKIMMTEIKEVMGLKGIKERFGDEEVKGCTKGMFPMDVPKNTRFAINYFTSIDLGVLTEEMREYLKNAPRLIMEQRRTMLAESSPSDSSSSDSSDTDSSDTSSDSDSHSDSDSDARSSNDSRQNRDKDRDRDRRHPSRRTPSPPPPPRRGRERDSPLTPPRRTRYEERERTQRSPPRKERSPLPPGRHRENDGDVNRDRDRERDRNRGGDRRNDSPPRNGRGRSPDERDRDRDRDWDRDRHRDRGRGRDRSPPPPRRQLPNSPSPSPPPRSPSPPRRSRYPGPGNGSGRKVSRSPASSRSGPRSRSPMYRRERPRGDRADSREKYRRRSDDRRDRSRERDQGYSTRKR